MIIAGSPWLVTWTTNELRTTEATTPTVYLDSLYPKLVQNGLLIRSGDGAYWIPHDDEALRLDVYAFVHLNIALFT